MGSSGALWYLCSAWFPDVGEALWVVYSDSLPGSTPLEIPTPLCHTLRVLADSPLGWDPISTAQSPPLTAQSTWPRTLHIFMPPNLPSLLAPPSPSGLACLLLSEYYYKYYFTRTTPNPPLPSTWNSLVSLSDFPKTLLVPSSGSRETQGM